VSDKQVRVLLISQNATQAEQLREGMALAAGASEFSIVRYPNLSGALDVLQNHHVDAALLDLALPDVSSTEALVRLREAAPCVPVIVMAGPADEALALTTLSQGAQDYLLKGHQAPDVVAHTILCAIERTRRPSDPGSDRAAQPGGESRSLRSLLDELRSALEAIYQPAVTLLNGEAGKLTNRQHEHLDAALKSVLHLYAILDELMEATGIEMPSPGAEPRCTELSGLIRETVGQLEPIARARGVSLRFETPPPHVPPANADSTRVREVIVNLIENAIKFTPEGGEVSVSAMPAKAPGFLQVAVLDTGCGVRPENRERVFDYLFQGEPGLRNKNRGLGLGLYVCKKLVNLHGGRMWVEERPDGEQGSMFCFTLPVFSLAEALAPLLEPEGRRPSGLALVIVRFKPKGSRSMTRADDKALSEAWASLEGGLCHDRQVLLPRMNSSTGGETLFVVARQPVGEQAALLRAVGGILEGCPSLGTAALQWKVSVVSVKEPARPAGKDAGAAATADRFQQAIADALQVDA